MKLNVRFKIALSAGLCLIIASLLLIAYGLYSSTSTQSIISARITSLVRENTLQNINNLASARSNYIQAKLQEGLDAARTMAQSFEVAQKEGVRKAMGQDRNRINNLLKTILLNNDNFYSTFSAWEPQALDNQDLFFRKSDDTGSEAGTGRFLPSWSRDSTGQAVVATLDNYDNQDSFANGILKGGWYQIPKSTLQESVYGPVPVITDNGSKIWQISLSVPIVVDDQFLGIAGITYNQAFIQQLVEQLDADLFKGQGRAIVINYDGIIIAESENPDLTGEHISSVVPDSATEIIQDTQNKTTKSFYSDDNQILNAIVPLTLGKTTTPWSVMISLPQTVALSDVLTLKKEMADRSVDSSLWQIVVGVIVSAAFVLLLWLLAGRLAKPVSSAVELAQDIRVGEFSKRLDHKSNDEIGQLTDALNTMASSLQEQVLLAERISQGDLNQTVNLASDRDKLGLALQRMIEHLNALVSQVQQGSQEISKNAAQMAELSQGISEGAANSATSVTEISTTITQMTQQTSESAENAHQADVLSKESQRHAEEGNQLMEELNHAMKEIGDSGKNITDIIKTINDIASQTNLLALNAAIEAARAGEQGRGFAVVADEVRSLAARSSKAASESAAMIESTTEKTRAGTEIAAKTAASLKEIVTSAQKVSDLVSLIALSSSEQASALKHASIGLEQIDQVTHQNSQSAEECASAAQVLTQQARQLQGLISTFKVKS
ncbi:methyl-accepting chemotaxis protein [Gynuella sunshinyii]|uniref:Methyl-accepting chemotaxis protein n=1 Tax=Gynuella sunshinyii YC6258 TaxID=1445510 RepID=A0A0C5W426_9GAMM|nr:methyl-accepting chemotaxis protein [Gynuella sunshinyii]AJQ97374.1 methyl-accepting chemotaxis protein [Gynuella sunshinyii YC6258]